MTRNEIPTPALLLDIERFERNIAKMAAHVKAAGKKLRPHSKTHKCPEIARRQIAAGAVGICCAKAGEAEVMAASGIRNILITTEVVGPEKIGRLVGVLEQAPEPLAVVANADNARELSQAMASAGQVLSAMARAGKVLNVLVDVDVGGRRTGTQPGENAVHIGRLVTLEASLNLRGLQGYAGHCAHVPGYANRRKTSHRWMNKLMKTRDLFEKNSLPVEIVSGGSSGTSNIGYESRGVTAIQTDAVRRAER